MEASVVVCLPLRPPRPCHPEKTLNFHESACIHSFIYSSFSSMLDSDNHDEEDAKSEEDESESVRRRVTFGCLKMAAGKWSHGPYGL